MLIAWTVLLLAADQIQVEDAYRAAYAKKFPGQEIVAACKGSVLGKKTPAAAIVLFDPNETKFRVTWIAEKNEIKELETVPQSGDKKTLELRCMPAEEAAAHAATIAKNTAMNSFLKVPKGSGLFCYAEDEVTTKCFGIEEKTGALIEAGGWET